EVLGAADEPHRGHPEAALVQGPLRGGDDVGVVGQTQVVVGAEVQHLGAVTADGPGGDPVALRGRDDALVLEGPGLLDLGALGGQLVLEVCVHRGPSGGGGGAGWGGGGGGGGRGRGGRGRCGGAAPGRLGTT